MVIDEDEDWPYLEETAKIATVTASFSCCEGISGPLDVFQAYSCTFSRSRNPITSNSLLAADSISSSYTTKRVIGKARKEATATDTRQYKRQFLEAKLAEIKSWIDNDVYELVDLRKVKTSNRVSGRWVLTIKRGKDGEFLKCKARWVLRGFQDKQKDTLQTDSPTSTRPGFRLTCQQASSSKWSVAHIDLKTAFLQGQEYDAERNVIAQLPPEAGYAPHIGARLKKAAYGMADAPRQWWNRLDASLRRLNFVPTRADRCTYVKYSSLPRSAEEERPPARQPRTWHDSITEGNDGLLDYLLDPITGSPALHKKVDGIICLHVDDLLLTGSSAFIADIKNELSKEYEIGSFDLDDVVFCGQRLRWQGDILVVDQNKAIEELTELNYDKTLPDSTVCSPELHTGYRSVLGQLNWLQSRTQYHIAYAFSRRASASAGPTIADVKAINKVVRQVRAQPVTLRFHPLKGKTRIVGYPDASYRNNPDASSQRGQVIFIAEPRERSSKDGRGSLVDYESQKIRRTTLSTTVAELYSVMKCFGTCQFTRGLWKDISGQSSEIHLRTDANNLITTASTTHLPEQRETMHMLHMLRTESTSGAIQDLAHIRTHHCLSDCLTKNNAKPDNLITATRTGILPDLDSNPLFREMIKHKAFLCDWLIQLGRETNDNRLVRSAFFYKTLSTV